MYHVASKVWLQPFNRSNSLAANPFVTIFGETTKARCSRASVYARHWHPAARSQYPRMMRATSGLSFKLQGSMDLGTEYCWVGGASGSALGTHTNVLDAIILVLVACLLDGCLLIERTRCSSPRQAIMPVRYCEGMLATIHNAATGERGYRNTCPSNAVKVDP